MSEKKPHCSIL